MPTTESSTPTLQPPGAGLPWWELLAARYIVFPRACRKLTWATAIELFQEEGARVLTVWDALPPERLGERVLIRRIAGIEDSSRFWSAAMTLEHLMIVGTGIRRTIASLRRGEVPNRTANTADVKPSGESAPAEVRAGFVSFLAEPAEPPMSRGEGPRFKHPWFGPIDAFQWHCLLGIHQGLHRRQIEAIRMSIQRKRA